VTTDTAPAHFTNFRDVLWEAIKLVEPRGQRTRLITLYNHHDFYDAIRASCTQLTKVEPRRVTVQFFDNTMQTQAEVVYIAKREPNESI
jgi:hypothetical protein